MAEDLNVITPEGRAHPADAGDLPERVRRRYLTETRGRGALDFYVDARIETAAFRDHGRRLTTDRNDPNVVRDLVAIAQHRGWTTLKVEGQAAFRREVWAVARAAGLEVRGYRPTVRDQQELTRRADTRGPSRRRDGDPTGQDRLRVVEAVVRNRVVEPAEQSHILAAARERLASWLERGAQFDAPARARGHDRVR
ncbi:MAG TPA: LPD7 domain-containing protein [Phenylobacterium sp.]|jgi:hypothetical protein